MAKISREDAFSLLSKWNTETTALLVSLDDTEVSFSGCGSICSLSDELVYFEGSHGELHLFRFSVALQKVKEFEYSDVREETEEFRKTYGQLVDQKLLLNLPLGGCVRIFTRKPLDERD